MVTRTGGPVRQGWTDGRPSARIARQMSFEFHVSRDARQRYDFDEALFRLSGNVVFADYAAARRFAHAMNAQRDVAADPARAVRAGDINAMGLVDEVLHYVIELYRRQRNPEAMAGALAALDQRLGSAALEAALEVFADRFPTVAAYRGEQSAADYLAGSTDGRPNRQIALEELLMVWLANGNPAFGPYEELFQDTPLADGSSYNELIGGLRDYFRTQPGFGPDGDDLISLLQRPARESPRIADAPWARLQSVEERHSPRRHGDTEETTSPHILPDRVARNG